MEVVHAHLFCTPSFGPVVWILGRLENREMSNKTNFEAIGRVQEYIDGDGHSTIAKSIDSS